MKNHLLVGKFTLDRLFEISKPPFLLIGNEETTEYFAARYPHAKLFDPHTDSFSALRGDPRQFTALLDALFPEGASTLTRRNENFLLRNAFRLLQHEKATLLEIRRMLSDTSYRDKLIASCENDFLVSTWEIIRTWDPKDARPAIQKITDLLESETLRNVTCKPANFSIKRDATIIARIDPAELSDFDVLALSTFLIDAYPDQIIMPNFGVYGRPFHIPLIRQDRLIAGMNYLTEFPLPPDISLPLQQAVLTIEDKTVYQTTPEDADRLKFYLGVQNTRRIIEQEGAQFLSTG